MQTILKEIVLTNIVNNNCKFKKYELKYQTLIFRPIQLKNITEFHINKLMFEYSSMIDKTIEFSKHHNCEVSYILKYKKLKCKNIITSNLSRSKKIKKIIKLSCEFSVLGGFNNYDPKYQNKWWHEQAIKFEQIAYPNKKLCELRSYNNYS
jgi:hypothetical protein